MEQPIIEVDQVSMHFNLAEERTDTIKEYVIKLIQGKLRYNEFVALDDISFTMERGDSLALIGKNGSGKSTLLKIIAGVISPSKGSVRVNGAIAPLIELGAGFDPDLTARENIFLNGAVMGFDRAFMSRHFDEIIDFSELQGFVDVPIKNFSSGMVARLGFAIATIVKTDILVVDEILSVGDFMFQQKCQQRISQMLENGATLLFVSHSIGQVKDVCRRALWLEHGRAVEIGPSREVCDHYVARENGCA